MVRLFLVYGTKNVFVVNLNKTNCYRINQSFLLKCHHPIIPLHILFTLHKELVKAISLC
jgi:hypothetical protein